MQLNQLREDVEDEQRPSPVPPVPQPGGHTPPPAPASDPASAHAHATAPAPVAPLTWPREAIPKIGEGDEIKQYLVTFERPAMAHRWPREDWAVF